MTVAGSRRFVATNEINDMITNAIAFITHYFFYHDGQKPTSSQRYHYFEIHASRKHILGMSLLSLFEWIHDGDSK